MSGRSPVTSSRNLDHVHFTPLEVSEPASPGSPETGGTSTLHGNNGGGDSGNGGIGGGGGGGGIGKPSTITNTVKIFRPYISLKKAVVVIVVAALIIVVAVVGAVLIADITSDAEDLTSSVNKTDTTATTTATTSLTSSTSWVPITSSTPRPSSSSVSSTSETTTPSSSLSSETTTTLSSSSSVETTIVSSTTVSSTPTSAVEESSRRPPCNSSEFICTNWNCVPFHVVCDGFPDCSDGSDEGIPCACSRNQFQCPNGQCVPQSAVCDQHYDCIDKGDEANCPDCAGFRCKTNNVCLWDRMTRRCNLYFDCDDLTDEMDCPTRSSYYFCKNGVQIPLQLQCDELDDCGDNSDEENCTCHQSREFTCPGAVKKCIPSTWRCDGHPDCPNGADEQNCVTCSEDSYPCFDYTCVDMALRCDGKVDCLRDDGDENGCVHVSPSGEVQVSLGGDLWPVCADGWDDEHSSWVCSTLHTSPVQSWSSQQPPVPPPGYAFLQYPKDKAGLTNFKFRSTCPSTSTVHVSCQRSECGLRKVEVLQSFIAGGEISPLGKWPWVVSLSYLNKPICAGVLLDKKWVLTAAHCVMYPVPGNYNFSTTPFYFSVTVGSTSNSAGLNSTAPPTPASVTAGRPQLEAVQIVKVAVVIIHPKTHVTVNGGVDWDLALLKLGTEVKMNSFVQPICLPDQGMVFLPTSYCSMAGWGFLSYRQDVKPDRLRDTRMQLWSEGRCSTNTVIGETSVNTNSTLCAGFLFGRPTGCQGDSGGPLMCLDVASGRYLLAGIVSRGSDQCGRKYPNAYSNRYARVAMAVTWIQTTMDNA